MSRNVRLRIVARLDQARPQEGTIVINRAAGLFSVRPLRRRREYTVPLAAVAEMVVTRIIRAEVADKLAARRRGKRGR